MKNRFTDLSQKRSAGNALLFYLVTFVILVCSGMTLGFLGGLLFGLQEVGGLLLGAVLAVIVCTYLTVATAKQKNILKTPLGISLIIITLIVAFLSGGLGGLIPATVLSLVNSNTNQVELDVMANG